MAKRLFSSFMIIALLVTLFPVIGYTQTTKNEKIVSLAKGQLGVPYRFGGSSPKGFDCSGFLYYVFKEAGITLPRTSSAQYNTGAAVKKSELQVGDLVFFETYKSGPSHSGIYVGNNNFIHASSSTGISISSVNDPHYWSSRYLGAKRVVEMPITAVLAALSAGQYHDIAENHWAHKEVLWLGEQNIINGYDQSLFLPNELVTRSQAATVISNALGLDTSNRKNNFKDVAENHWAAGAIAAVANEGFITGMSENIFNPEAVLTREQVAVVFERAFELIHNGETGTTFNDVSENYWAYPAIELLTKSGISGGYSDNTYRPKQAVTRAELSVLVHRVLHMN